MSEDDDLLEGEPLPFLQPEAELLRYLRRRRGLTQVQLGAKAKLSGQAINHFELGRRHLRPKHQAHLNEAMEYDRFEVALYRLVVDGRPSAGEEAALAALGEGDGRLVRSVAAEHGVLEAQELQGRLAGAFVHSVGGGLRREAERLFQAWEQAPEAERPLLLEQHPDFQDVPLIEQFCLASERVAAKDPKLPLLYSQIALRAAERLPGPPKRRWRLQGYVWGFVGNARRVGVGLRQADEAFGTADRLWTEGAGARGLFLEEWRLPDLKASLRRDQRLWQESLDLSDLALVEAPESARGRILVKKAFALQQMAEWKAALRPLEEAGPLVEAAGDRTVLLAYRFNLAVSLTHLGKLTEARRWVAESRTLCLELGRDVDLVRCLWISGLIAGESGERAEAVATLAQARDDFTARKMPLEAASVALDEAVYLLQSGETRAVAILAEEVAWVFGVEGVREEALKALRLFAEAARQHRITVDLARQLRERFRRAA